eukprot:581893-Rhodomonas_salina.1
MNALRSFGTLRLQLFLGRTGGLYALARVAQEKQLYVEHLRACPRCPIAQSYIANTLQALIQQGTHSALRSIDIVRGEKKDLGFQRKQWTLDWVWD